LRPGWANSKTSISTRTCLSSQPYGSINRRILVQAGPAIKVRPWTAGMDQAVECLLAMWKALSSNPSPTMKREKETLSFVTTQLNLENVMPSKIS
jgi:hypothetical protein